MQTAPAPRQADPAWRMRAIATGMLVVMAGIFLATHWAEGHVDARWGYVRAFAEAAMVGGLADWFAVTALFRHPLGLPIPHTAIIPRNKDRIGDTMAQFLRSNFLTPLVVARRMRNMNVAAAAGRFLVQPTGGEGRLRLGASNMVADVLESLDQDRLGGNAKEALRQQLEKLDVAPLLGQILSAAIADNRHLPLMDGIVKWTQRTLFANEDLLKDMVRARANSIMRWTGLDERLATGIIDGLHNLLFDMAEDVNHPLRHKVEEGLETLAYRLLHDPEMQDKVRGIKAEMLANPAMARWLDGLWERSRAALLRAARDPDNALSGQFGDGLRQIGESLQNDPRMQMQINRFARRTLVGISNRYGDQIVRLVSETVRRWDARTITDRVENAVGKDLQFIRINGTLVGGLVGLTIHTATVWLG
jgi:uncharacterized membrane-anchored protein YjiN (DUF445 family)